jgi:hypothetical protein
MVGLPLLERYEYDAVGEFVLGIFAVRVSLRR